MRITPPDIRVRKALKSLATLGTSQGVAQAVMWHVCNGMSYDQLASQNVKSINIQELGQAARFVQALDSSGSGEIVEPVYFQQGRILARIVGEGILAKDAKRLAAEFDGVRVLGLPVTICEESDLENAQPGALLLNIVLTGSKPTLTSAKVTVRHGSAFGMWIPLGQADVREAVALSEMKGDMLANAVGHSVSRAFVTVTPVRRTTGVNAVRITNRLPMTLAHVSLKTGKSNSDLAPFDAVGIGPMRTAMFPISSTSASVESVDLNGL